MALNRINKRSLIAAAHDGVMAGLSLVIALYMRLGDDFLAFTRDYLAHAVVMFVCICLPVFFWMRLYRGLWRFASMRDMIAIAKSVSLAIVIFAACMFLFNRLELMPRSVLFINWMLLMVMLAAPRFVYRSLKDRTLFWEMTLEEKAKIPVLLIGATSLAEQFIQDMARDPRTPYRVVGMLDEDRSRKDRMLQRVRIYGHTDLLAIVLRKLERKNCRPHKILIADTNLPGDVIREIMRVADEFALPVARIPRLSELKQHFDEKLDIQPIAIEDLLGRAQTPLDRGGMRAMIRGKRVLVTGAGGSIGSELVRQIHASEPASLILMDASEYNLYRIDLELAAHHYTPILGDVRDERLVANIMTTHRPEIVFHAAAVKHVPLSEVNPEEAILTNVCGTQVVANACVAHQVPLMVMISTDKAVNPTNIMGATKKLAESYCQALAAQPGTNTQFVTVRFGNVLGSTGSVVPLFQEQIRSGGPVTVTHAEMTRYFMTIREAVELVLQAAVVGSSDKKTRAHIYVLDMGKPIKILDLAEQMIRLAGRKPYQDIPITFTGLRPGEKMHEELFHEAEPLMDTPHPRLFLAHPRVVEYQELQSRISALKQAASNRHTAQAVVLLKALVPEFHSLSHVA